MDTALKRWEKALLIALCITLLCGVFAGKSQAELSEKLVRLHVVGASDSEEDQALKLLARDGVVELLSRELEGARDSAEARRRIESLLGEIEDAAEAASGQAATAAIASEYFPTRDYGSFSLPAGEYTSLRVTLGEGSGRNWWCVVFPPLCTELAAEDFTETAGLDGDELALITEEGGYMIKFRIIELWDAVRQFAIDNF